jgi:hypothetical protein
MAALRQSLLRGCDDVGFLSVRNQDAPKMLTSMIRDGSWSSNQHRASRVRGLGARPELNGLCVVLSRSLMLLIPQLRLPAPLRNWWRRI